MTAVILLIEEHRTIRGRTVKTRRNYLKIFFLKKLCNNIEGRVTKRPWVGWRRRNPTTTPKGESPLAQFYIEMTSMVGGYLHFRKGGFAYDVSQSFPKREKSQYWRLTSAQRR